MSEAAARIWDIGTDIGGTFTDIVGVDTVSQDHLPYIFDAKTASFCGVRRLTSGMPSTRYNTR